MVENYKNIKYGTILKIKNFTGDGEIDTVMLIDNCTGFTKYKCLILDLSSKEILGDFEDITNCLNNIEIVELVGSFDELFNI